MERIKFENVNNIEARKEKKEDMPEVIEKEQNSESMKYTIDFIEEEGELIEKDTENKENKEEPRVKTFFRQAIIGTTIMVSLWSMGKMDSSKAESSESNTQVEQQDNLDETPETEQEKDAQNILKILSDLPDNPNANSPRHNKILKKGAGLNILKSYFDRYEDKQAADILLQEMNSLEEPLMGPGLLALMERLSTIER